jgi:hypothetical protein
LRIFACIGGRLHEDAEEPTVSGMRAARFRSHAGRWSTRGRGSFPRRAREHASCGIFCAGKRLVERGDLVPGCGNAEAPEVAFRSGSTFLLCAVDMLSVVVE